MTAWLDLAGLRPAGDGGRRVDVLNGIAYDAAGDRLLVTGKLWPRLFQVRPRADPASQPLRSPACPHQGG